MPLHTHANHIPTSRIYPVRFRKIIKKFLVMEVSATDEGQRIWRSLLGIMLLMGGFLLALGYAAGPSQAATFIYMLALYVLVVVMVLLFIFIYEFLYVWTYYYDIGESFVKIRKGVILRREVSVPYSHIQDVNVDQDIFDHLLRLYDVHISTASEKYLLDPHIDGLNYRDAEKILEMIHAQIEQSHQSASSL